MDINYLDAGRVEVPLFPRGMGPTITLSDIKERRFDLFNRDTTFIEHLQGNNAMLDRHDDRTITANVDEVLQALHENLTDHKEIVEEARDGYLEKCREALKDARKRINKRLKALDDGKEVNMTHIGFNLQPPQDHSKEFVTVIKMLELHKAALDDDPEWNGPATIELKAIDVQRFVLNEWEWQDQFLSTNSMYSDKAAVLFSSSV
jgi:hypothetical protein